MMNPAIEMKSNAIQAFKDEVTKISIQFANANITIGHLAGSDKPADGMTKLFKNPMAIINSKT